MFGEEWEPAVGMLLSTRYGGKHGDWSGNASVTANSVHYLMEVRPLSGGETFRCECEPPSLMLSFQSPPMDVEIKMECIPSKKRARFDRSEPAINRHTVEHAQYDHYQALLHETPNAPTGPAAGNPAFMSHHAGGGTSDLVDQLAKLSELHAAGDLTDQQFEAMKAAVISKAQQ
jgi:hypothetical protein